MDPDDPPAAGEFRTELGAYFRPGADPTKILWEAVGWLDGVGSNRGQYTAYGAPRYARVGGGYTLNVLEAYDFSAEDNVVALLAGGVVPDPITTPAPAADASSLTKLYRADNNLLQRSDHPGEVSTFHFTQNVGGSRYWNPGRVISSWPGGGEVSPPLSLDWLTAFRVVAQGLEHFVEAVVTDEKPAGAFYMRFAQVDSDFFQEYQLTDPDNDNRYRSGNQVDFPVGRQLKVGLRLGADNININDGRHLVALINEETLKVETARLEHQLELKTRVNIYATEADLPAVSARTPGELYAYSG